MTQELRFFKSHAGSFEEGIELINRYPWNLRVEQKEIEWLVWAGDQIILRTDSRDSLDAFLYGMALASSIMPNSLIEQLNKLNGHP